MSRAITLGPFDLEARVARGGMGEIWRARHRAQGVPVAIKVLAEDIAKEARHYDAFRREVQAAARLSHPNVAVLFDYGLVPPETARDGGLVAGSPYLAMEWCERGSLDRRAHAMSWREVRGVLLALLEALAHAHARGVIHRDLKPSNLLLTDAPRLDRALRLADFGIAHAIAQATLAEGALTRDRQTELSGITEGPAGTPLYMAPEQVHGRFRDYGPWTDLYSLGLLAWELVSGEPPFMASSMVALLYMQLEEPLPPLRPRMQVPAGLEAWIRRLAEKRARDRPRCAADAAWTLSQLPDPLPSDRPLQGEPGHTAFLATMPSLPVVAARPASDPPAKKRVLELAIESEDERLPAQPAHWSAPTDAPGELHLVGVGLGLYFLRSVPLVGREAQRDVLWEELRRVRLERQPRVVVVRGQGGLGKTRLVDWLAERAQETGAATVLATSHALVGSGRQGLARLVEKHYGCAKLDPSATLARLEAVLREDGVTSAWEWRALAGIVVGAESEERLRDSVVTPLPPERNALLTRVIQRASRERPAIVVLDDVQWGEASLELVTHLLAESGLPVLLVLTANDESLAERPRERAQIGAITEHREVRTLRLGALDAAQATELLSLHLGLSRALAARVDARCGGNPLFALQIVGDWVNRDALVPTPDGFVLREGERAELPDDLHAAWMARVSRVLAGKPHLWPLVELAAVLGHDVDASEFARACAALGTAFPDDLLEPLLLHRLVVPDEAGWVFASGLLRESLERAAREAGRLFTLHRACAQAIDRTRPLASARIAHHLLGAGDPQAAIEPLLAAARESLAASDIGGALALLERLHAVLAPHDPRAIEALVVRADAHRIHWDFDAAERDAGAALEAATHASDARSRAEALSILAHCARQRGDIPLAASRNRQALTLFDRLGDDRGRARTIATMAALARQEGSPERTLDLYERADALFAQLGDDLGRAVCQVGLGNLHRSARRWESAKECYRKGRALADGIGNQDNLAHSVNGLAEIARYEGDLDGAERGYREALAIQTAIGSKASFIPRANLAIVLLARMRYDEARRELTEALGPLEKRGQRGYLGMLHALLLPCAAAAGDVAALDRHLATAGPLLAATKLTDPDIALAAEDAARLLAERGDTVRAGAARELAIAQWTAMGDAARAAALRG